MNLFDILNFSITDVIDILLFASLLYYLYRLIKGTVAINIFMGIVMIYLMWKITEALQMQLLSSILGQFIGVGVFALIVVFQQEIRRFLLTIGTTNITARNKLHSIFKFFKQKEILLNIESLVNVCEKLGSSHTGALIVLERNVPLNFVTETGDKMNLEFSEPKSYGLRHRAAVSITEKTDATAIVVSEETGHISYFKNGTFVNFKGKEELITLIEKDFK